MAGGNISPRQKMINMLYLVLLALLALNVSAEVLNAFRLVNDSLIETRKNFETQSQNLYARFDNAYQEDQEELEEYWNRAQQIRQRSDQLVARMEDLKQQLAEMGGGYLEDGSISKGDNLNYAPELMLFRGKGEELKNEILEVRQFYYDMLEQSGISTDEVVISLNAEDPEPRPGEQSALSWEEQLFQSMPVTPAVTSLSRLQNDVRNSETEVIERLLRFVAQDMRIQFDETEAQVIPTSNYIMIGEEFQAEIFLAAFSRATEPEIYIEGNRLDPEQVRQGKGIFTDRPNREGEHTFSGYIELPGEEGRDEFEIRYQAFEPAAIISADAMNLMYAGLENPISVSVPGYPSDRVQANISNGTLHNRQGDGKYMVTLPDGTRETTVSAFVETDDGERKRMGSQDYRVRNVPRPAASLGGQREGEISAGQAGTFQFISVTQGEGFAFDLQYDVVRYRFIHQPRRGDFLSTTGSGRDLTGQMRNRLSNASSGDVFIITEVQVSGPEGTRPADGVTLTIQ